MSLFNKTAVPNFPLATEEYRTQYHDQFNNILRLYLNLLNNNVNNVVGTLGGQYLDFPNALFFNTADQTFAAINTAYPVVFDQTYIANGVELQSGSTSKIQVNQDGVYNFQYTGQVLSSSSSAKTIYLWIKRNGVDIGYSTRARTISANNQYSPMNWAFNIDLAAGEYLELQTSVTDTTLTLDAVPATSPHPGIPSSVMSVNLMSSLPVPRPTAP